MRDQQAGLRCADRIVAQAPVHDDEPCTPERGREREQRDSLLEARVLDLRIHGLPYWSFCLRHLHASMRLRSSWAWSEGTKEQASSGDPEVGLEKKPTGVPKARTSDTW